MLRLDGIRLPVGHGEADLERKVRRLLGVEAGEPLTFRIARRSLDARKKPALFFEYSVEAEVAEEERFLKNSGGRERVRISRADTTPYVFPAPGREELKDAPVIVGSGPAGLFCAYLLTLHGYAPLVLERGEDVETRQRSVLGFWEGGRLDPNSNVQFGEGGAGTFSDGKLNTLVKDAAGRSRFVLETFVRFGAPGSILYERKPHLGTDLLSDIVRRMREEIIRLGGRVCFSSQATDFLIEKGRIAGVVVNGDERISAQAVALAVGHSARDTFDRLLALQVPMEAKAFAVGMRVEHLQEAVNLAQLGTGVLPRGLGAADYKLTHRAKNGRSVYSFCMCPGGYVVNASSEEGYLAVNGMSYHKRDGVNANSAIIVSVSPGDFKDASPLAGVEFQRILERRAYEAGQGCIPVQLLGDFRAGRPSREFGRVLPQTKGASRFADLRGIFPEPVAEAFLEGMEAFGRKIRGFDREDAVLSAPESRTSSPVRILRDENGVSEVDGLYPAGEGAGYAGGIMSAAMDGMRTAEKMAARYRPLKDISEQGEKDRWIKT